MDSFAYASFRIPFLGFATYVNLVKDLISGKDVYRYAMTQEVERAHQCIDLALSGKTVSLVSSGDPGIYGMAGLIPYYGITLFYCPSCTISHVIMMSRSHSYYELRSHNKLPCSISCNGTSCRKQNGRG